MSWSPDDEWLRENGLLDEDDEVEFLKEHYKELPRVIDIGDSKGVLLKSAIKEVNEKINLIQPFDARNLKSASYDLTVGAAIKRYNKGTNETEIEYLRNKGDAFTIKPYEAVQIQTEERLNLPINLIARWNIRVKWANKGLIWAGAPQVDPGWRGRLSPPIFNLSSKSVTLKRGESLATMDFVTTTIPDKSVDQGFDFESHHVTIKNSKYEPIMTALAEHYNRMAKFDEKHKEQIEDLERFKTGLESKIVATERNVSTLSVFTVGVLALTVSAAGAALGHLFGFGNTDVFADNLPTLGFAAIFGLIVFGLALFAIKYYTSSEK